jgi:leucyl aminopeptidase
MTVTIPANFNPVPSHATSPKVKVIGTRAKTSRTKPAVAMGVDEALAIVVSMQGELPKSIPLSRDELARLGFEAKKKSTLVLADSDSTRVLVGSGDGPLSPNSVRDAVAAVVRAVPKHSAVQLDLRGLSDEAIDVVAQAAVEGALLARYRYEPLKSESTIVPLKQLTLVVKPLDEKTANVGAKRGSVLARAAALARDLGNTPPRHLTAERFANVVAKLAPEFGLKAEVYDRAKLVKMGCGGLLGVNAGSIEEPRMVKLTYSPRKSQGHLALVGKGIMYDSGGISLKPSGAMHATMKLDMSGAAAVFAAMTTLKALGTSTTVTGFLMCTDNMPSGSATKLGDVLTIRGGKTVEVKNTDAEGRLVLADGLTLATELKPDAIIDIATLTGAALAALGPLNAAVFANNDSVLSQVTSAAEATDESLWQLPLDHRYRETLNSEIADLQNIGGEYGGAITAALFLNEFVEGIPWAHLDIAATMRSEKDALWKSTGATGFGTRLLASLAEHFVVPSK